MVDTEKNHFDHLKLRHLKLLELIEEYASLRRAAEILCVSQPAVTVMLRDLEKKFDAALVTRSHTGVQLTKAGAEVRARLHIVFNEISVARAAVRDAQDRQILRIGTLPVAIIELIPMAVKWMEQQGELPRIVLREGGVDYLLQSLEKGELDCVIGRFGDESEYQVGLDYEFLGQESLHIVCRRHHRILRRDKLSLKDLLQEKWIIPAAGTLARRKFDHSFLNVGLRPPVPTIESSSFYANVQFIMSTDMLAIAPTTAVRMFERLGQISRVGVPPLQATGSTVFICRTASAELPVLARFREGLGEASKFLAASLKSEK